MSDSVIDKLGIEHLLAAAIIAAGGVLTVNADDITSVDMEGRYIGLALNDDNTITMELVDYDNTK